MLLVIATLLILSWLVSVLILGVTDTLIHVLILAAVLVYMLHLLKKGKIA